MGYKLITETVLNDIVTESKGQDLYIYGIYSSADVKNNNGRVYKKSLLEREINKAIERASKKTLYGELNHPSDPSINLERAAILTEHLDWRDTDVYGKSKVLKTPKGDIIRGIIESGGNFGISSRGLGTVAENGYVEESYNLITWDVVGDPSNPASEFVNGIYEGKEFSISGEEREEKKLTLEDAVKEHHKRIWQVIDGIKKSL
jgi:hypothetical protein